MTEQRTITVEVRHEEAQLTIRPVDAETPDTHAAHAALPEMTLYEEQIVITRRLVPTERVRLQITFVTVGQPVTADLSYEAIIVLDPEQPAATSGTTPTTPDQEAARP